MEGNHIKTDGVRPDKFNISTNPTGPTSSERRCHGAVVLSLSLLSVFLLAGLIGLGVHYHGLAAELSSAEVNLGELLEKASYLTEEKDRLKSTLIEVTKERDRLQSLSEHNHGLAAELSSVKANLSERLQISYNKSLSLTEERDQLNSTLIEVTKERDRLQSLSEHNHGLAAELSSVKANLSERLQISYNKSLSLTEERDQLKSTLIEVTKERDRLQSLSEHKKTCPSGWTLFSSSCYLLSTERGSWDKGRQDCRDRGADLVVIDSTQKQTFLYGLTSDAIWIGLSDKEQEGVWKWVDGAPLTLTYWADKEPNNQDREENCAHIRGDEKKDWNDLSCSESLKWICERLAS